MITYIKGNIFDTPAELIVNPVNTAGVMGKGIALEFKKRYPDMYETYRLICKNHELQIGTLYLYRQSEKILLFPTKKHWKDPSRLEYIESGLRKIADKWDELGVNSIALPKLGCGNGGLNWNEVRPLMEKYLRNLPIIVLVYTDDYKEEKSESTSVTEIEEWLNGEANAYGYERFRIKFKNYIANNPEFNMSQTEKYILTEHNEAIQINDTVLEDLQMCQLWSWVHDVGIILPREIPYEFQPISKVFLEIMQKLSYTSRIYISFDGINYSAKPNGYQYIAK